MKNIYKMSNDIIPDSESCSSESGFIKLLENAIIAEGKSVSNTFPLIKYLLIKYENHTGEKFDLTGSELGQEHKDLFKLFTFGDGRLLMYLHKESILYYIKTELNTTLKESLIKSNLTMVEDLPLESSRELYSKAEVEDLIVNKNISSYLFYLRVILKGSERADLRMETSILQGDKKYRDSYLRLLNKEH